jgi:transcriptional regulator with XRE-family HTH domain
MDPSTSIGKVVTTLKNQLRARAISYRAVAARMNVSAVTIKRYLNGKGLTLDILERLAEVVELDLLSLVVMAQGQNPVQTGLSKAQLAALSRAGPTRRVFVMLNGGWTPSQVAREFDLEDQIDSILARLEGWGLIRRLSGGAVQVLVKPDMEGPAYGQMKEFAIEAAQRFLRDLDLRELQLEWIFYPLLLSPPSVSELEQLIRRFQADLRVLAKREVGRNSTETQWYSLFLGARPIPRKEVLRKIVNL